MLNSAILIHSFCIDYLRWIFFRLNVGLNWTFIHRLLSHSFYFLHLHCFFGLVHIDKARLHPAIHSDIIFNMDLIEHRRIFLNLVLPLVNLSLRSPVKVVAEQLKRDRLLLVQFDDFRITLTLRLLLLLIIHLIVVINVV